MEILYVLIATHITIVCVTLFLHRGQAHKAIIFSPIIEHFMRFWLWLTTGMVTKEWVAIHRKHHSLTDKPGDPHSPVNEGLLKVLFKGAFLYHEASKNKKMVNSFGVGTPNDWLESNVYSRHTRLGIGILLLFNLAVFGWVGAIIWGVQMIWIPLWAAGVINGVGHSIGYRNHETKDNSTNILPVGILIGGEELHNNHHNDPANPKLSNKPWEFDIGWFWFKILQKLRLAKLRD